MKTTLLPRALLPEVPFPAAPSGEALGGWLSPPILLTPELARLTQQEAVVIRFGDLPEHERHRYADEHGRALGDPAQSETVGGYFYLADEPGGAELADPHPAGLFVELQDGSCYYVIGQHSEGGCTLPELAGDGRLFLISLEDYLRVGGGSTPDSYRLDRLGTDERRQDPYRRVAERLRARAGQDQHARQALRARRAGGQA